MIKFLRKLLPKLLPILFLSSSLYAGSFGIEEFKGMNVVENKLLIEESKSPDMDNCDISEDGLSVSRRLGQEFEFEITYSTWTIKSFGSVKNATYDKIIVGYGPHIEAFDAAYSSTMLHSSATPNYIWDFTEFQGNSYATNGIDTVFFTDGNAITFITSAPKGKSIVFFNDTAWIANTAADRASVQYSAYSDPTDWTTGAGPTDGRSFAVDDEGEKVVDLQILGNSLLILGSGGIFKAVGFENPYQIIEVDKSIGCKSKGSVVTHLGLTYFLGSDGQYYRTDGSLVENISDDEFFDAFDATAISQRSLEFRTVSSKADFELGIASGVSTSLTSGSVVLSSSSFVYDSASDWNQGSFVNWAVSDGNLVGDGPVQQGHLNPGSWTSDIKDRGVTAKGYYDWSFLIATDAFPFAACSVFIRTSDSATMGDNPGWTSVGTATASFSLGGAEFVTPSAVSGRYFQVHISTSGNSGGGNPAIWDWDSTSEIFGMRIIHKTTGYYITPEIITVDNNTWGLFEAESSGISGGASVNYFTFSSNTIVSDSDLQDSSKVTWTSQTNNALVVVATNTYVWAKVNFVISRSTDNPSLDAITVNWVSGSDSTEDMAAIWNDERLYLGVMENTSSSSNDNTFVWDPELNAWWKYKSGIFPSAFTNWNNKFLVASSTSGVVYEMLKGNTDGGVNIDAFWKSKYMTVTGGLSPLISSLEYALFVYDQKSSGNLLIDLMLNGATSADDTYTLDQTGGDNIHFDIFKFPQGRNARYFQFKVYNSGGSDFTFHGLVGETLEHSLKIKVPQ